MRVLLIRLRLIGDVVLSTPVIRALRRAFPDATLTYLVERDAAAVVAGNRDLDRIIAVERTRGLRRVLDDGSATTCQAGSGCTRGPSRAPASSVPVTPS